MTHQQHFLSQDVKEAFAAQKTLNETVGVQYANRFQDTGLTSFVQQKYGALLAGQSIHGAFKQDQLTKFYNEALAQDVEAGLVTKDEAAKLDAVLDAYLKPEKSTRDYIADFARTAKRAVTTTFISAGLTVAASASAVTFDNQSDVTIHYSDAGIEFRNVDDELKPGQVLYASIKGEDTNRVRAIAEDQGNGVYFVSIDQIEGIDPTRISAVTANDSNNLSDSADAIIASHVADSGYNIAGQPLESNVEVAQVATSTVTVDTTVADVVTSTTADAPTGQTAATTNASYDSQPTDNQPKSDQPANADPTPQYDGSVLGAKYQTVDFDPTDGLEQLLDRAGINYSDVFEPDFIDSDIANYWIQDEGAPAVDWELRARGMNGKSVGDKPATDYIHIGIPSSGADLRLIDPENNRVYSFNQGQYREVRISDPGSQLYLVGTNDSGVASVQTIGASTIQERHFLAQASRHAEIHRDQLAYARHGAASTQVDLAAIPKFHGYQAEPAAVEAANDDNYNAVAATSTHATFDVMNGLPNWDGSKREPRLAFSDTQPRRTQNVNQQPPSIEQVVAATSRGRTMFGASEPKQGPLAKLRTLFGRIK